MERCSPCGRWAYDVSVLTHTEAAAVAAPIHSVRLITYTRDPDRPDQTLDRTLELDSRHESMSEFLAEHNVIVNCVLQDTEAPLTFVTNDELSLFAPERSSSMSPPTPGWASSGRGRQASRSRSWSSATG